MCVKNQPQSKYWTILTLCSSKGKQEECWLIELYVISSVTSGDGTPHGTGYPPIGHAPLHQSGPVLVLGRKRGMGRGGSVSCCTVLNKNCLSLLWTTHTDGDFLETKLVTFIKLKIIIIGIHKCLLLKIRK